MLIFPVWAINTMRKVIEKEQSTKTSDSNRIPVDYDNRPRPIQVELFMNYAEYKYFRVWFLLKTNL